jgi:hypothetical protein
MKTKYEINDKNLGLSFICGGVILLHILYQPFNLTQQEIKLFREKLLASPQPPHLLPITIPTPEKDLEESLSGESVSRIGVISGRFVDAKEDNQIFSELGLLKNPSFSRSGEKSSHRSVDIANILHIVEQKLIDLINAFKNGTNPGDY